MPDTRGLFSPCSGLLVMRYVFVLACLFRVAAQNETTTLQTSRGNETTTLQTSQVHCCAVLKELHKFVRERDEIKCSTGTCNLIPLMLEFQKQTSSLLQNSVQVDGTHLMFVMPAESEHLYKLLVYAFLGRILHEEQSNSANSADYNTNKWMMFDSNTRTFEFQQSMCDFNKNIYTALVLSSISLLMFFIGVQVASNSREVLPAVTPACSYSQVLTKSHSDKFVVRQMPRANLKFHW